MDKQSFSNFSPVSQSVRVAQDWTLTRHIFNQSHPEICDCPRQADNREPLNILWLLAHCWLSGVTEPRVRGQQRRTSQEQPSLPALLPRAAQPGFACPAQQTKAAVHIHNHQHQRQQRLSLHLISATSYRRELNYLWLVMSTLLVHFQSTIKMDLPSLKSILCMKSMVSLELSDFANTNAGHYLHLNFK